MKKISTLITILFITVSLFSQSYFRYQGQKIQLSADSTAFVIQTNIQSAEKQNSALEKQLQEGEIKSFQKLPGNRFLVIGNKSLPGYYDYFSTLYRSEVNSIVIILPRIVVMLKQGANLQSVLGKYKGKLVRESGSNQKFILRCIATQSEEVLKLVNELDARDDIEWCEPEFLSEYRVDNTLYPQQYYLRNTGQNGGTAEIDINIEPAWNITSGSTCITVAVIDNGVDRNHEDMGARVLDGFTIRNPAGGGEPQNANFLDPKCHGMACAGILAASNNTIGIRGVASNVNILPVNIVPDAAYLLIDEIIYGFGTNIEIAEAISWAWRQADVLSCSWGGGAPSNYITVAIDSARTYGRNGRGCVVVFASGNDWPRVTDVAYPARLDGIITVGAINNKGKIWHYSQRGPSMDLVAPSGNIGGSGDVITIDRMGDLGANAGNYMANFGGTSAACPQVAGVAALMLSVRPDLTEVQVRTILQQTATDMGPYGFDNTYGYGRVNAYAAVQAVSPTITGPTMFCKTESYTLSAVPGSTVKWSTSPANWFSPGSGTGNTAFVSPGSVAFMGLGTLTFTVDTGCSDFTVMKTVLVNGYEPEIYGIPPDPSMHLCAGSFNLAWASPSTDGYYHWEVYGGTIVYGQGTNCLHYIIDQLIPPNTSETVGISLTIHGACGNPMTKGVSVLVKDCDGGGVLTNIYPNPVSDILTVELDNKILSQGNNLEIRLYDGTGNQLRQSMVKESTVRISVASLANGVYFLHIYDAKSDILEKRQVVVQH